MVRQGPILAPCVAGAAPVKRSSPATLFTKISRALAPAESEIQIKTVAPTYLINGISVIANQLY